MNRQHHVVVIGAGYAGIIAAKRLANKVDADTVAITLVNAGDHFVERPRLHQMATGQTTKALPLGALLGKAAVRLVVGWVDRIEPADRRIELSSADGPQILRYDTLILANGTVIDESTVPGIAEHATTLAPRQVNRLSRRLATLDSGEVVVCGGGMTGIEAATEIAETYPHLGVVLLSRSEPGAWLSTRARAYLAKSMARLGVTVRSGVEITGILAGEVQLRDGQTVAFDECVWAGGFAVPKLAADAGLKVNGKGRAIVDKTLRSVSHPEIHVIGDSAAVPGQWGSELAYGCRVSGFMGPYVADALAARLAGREVKEFQYRYIHQCISLGRKDAVIQFVDPTDESPRRSILTGRLAVWYKDTVLRSATWLFRSPGPYLPARRIRAAAKETLSV